jgi:hypothetical protein
MNEALDQLSKEGHFRCKSIFLGKLLLASKGKLNWLDFQLIYDGAERRNDLAHRGEVVPRGECWKYIEAIQTQLAAWKVIDVT